MKLYVVQKWLLHNSIWRTAYVSSVLSDAGVSYDYVRRMDPEGLYRLVEATHTNLDFLTHDARDFCVLLYGQFAESRS